MSAAGSGAAAKRPKHWDKMVSAAYLRMLGATQKTTAKAVGRIERTIRQWEADVETWNAARVEARERWFADADADARAAITARLRACDGDVARWFLERTDDRLTPPRVRAEISGPGGGPMEVAVTRQVVPAATNRIAAHANGRNGDGSP